MIDDEPDICDIICDILRAEVDETVAVTSAAAALEKLSEGYFDLVISDIMMPRMSGLELLKVLRPRKPKINVIFVSASNSDETLAEALEYGATDFILKPFSKADLIPLVKKYVALSKICRTNT